MPVLRMNRAQAVVEHVAASEAAAVASAAVAAPSAGFGPAQAFGMFPVAAAYAEFINS